MASVLPSPTEFAPAERQRRTALPPVARGVTKRRVGEFAAIALAFYTFLKMFYFFNEGLAQPADIMLAGLALFIASPNLVMSFLREHKSLLMLLIWIAMVNFTWALLTNKLNMAIPISYYLFNTIVVITTYAVRLKNPVLFDRYLIIALRIAIVAQLIAVLIDPNFRPLGTFQNPNQLAYWGVVALSTYLVIRRNETFWSDLPFLLIVTYCVIASLSRAGAAAAIIMLMAWFWMILKTPFRRTVGIFVGILMMIGASQTTYVTKYIRQSATAEDFQNRTAGREGNLAEERNYDRITEFYQYTVFGAGEGYYARFEPSTVTAIEIHSSFGTMLFSYGIVGLLLFCTFLYQVIRALPLSLGMYLMPALVYGVTHQGLRFSFFWVLVGIMIALGEQLQYRQTLKAKVKQKSAPVPLRERSARGPEQLRAMASLSTGPQR